MTGEVASDELRKRAIKQIKKKRDFKNHIVAYVVVNAFLVGVWAVAGGGYFWPGWVLAGWGIGVVFNAWDVYGRTDGVTEEQIQREMQNLKGS